MALRLACKCPRHHRLRAHNPDPLPCAAHRRVEQFAGQQWGVFLREDDEDFVVLGSLRLVNAEREGLGELRQPGLDDLPEALGLALHGSDALLAIHKSGYRYGTLNAFVSRFWGQFPSWYVLAPLAWSAPPEGPASVESIALERGSIGLQFSLYTRSMQLWNGLFGVYRSLQMVGGNAERLIDLVSLLETLSARKSGEVAKNFQRAERIVRPYHEL